MPLDPISEEFLKWLLSKGLEYSGQTLLQSNDILVLKEQIRSIPIVGRSIAINMLEKALGKLHEQNRTAFINRKMIEPVLENIAREPDTQENQEIFEMWQGLLESALTDESMSYGYSDILRQLNVFEVRILNELSIRLQDSSRTVYEQILDVINATSKLNFTKEEIDDKGEIAFINLKRLGLVEVDEVYHFERGLIMGAIDGGDISDNEIEPSVDEDRNLNVRFTAFGRDFMLKCRGSS